MAIKIRPMRPDEDQTVRELFEVCHPHWAPKPAGYFSAFSTLVAIQGSELIGSTSFFVSYPPPSLLPDEERFVMWGHGVYVQPKHRGQGLGLKLCDARLQMARRMGFGFFIGMTWPSNKPMIRIFEQQGLTLNPMSVSHAYPENFSEDQNGVMYTTGL